MVDRKSNQGNNNPPAPPDPPIREGFPDLSSASIDRVREVLREWRQRAFILPDGATLQIVPEMHRIVADVIWIDPTEQGAVFPTGNDDPDDPQPVWALTYRSLQRLERSAGFKWDSRLCHRLDDGSNPDLVVREAESYEAKLKAWYWQQGEGQIKSLEITARKRNWSTDYLARLKAEKVIHPESEREGWAREEARRAMMEIRKHRDTRAMSGAKARVIIEGLAVRRGGYFARDLAEKPFVILKLVPDINYASNPVAMAMLVAAETGLADMAFGAGVSMFGPGGVLGLHQAEPKPAALPAPRVIEQEAEAADPEDEPPTPDEPVVVPPEAQEPTPATRPTPTREPDFICRRPPADPQPHPAAQAAASAQTPSTPAPAAQAAGRRGPPLWTEHSFSIADREQRIEFLESLIAAHPQLPRIDFGRTTDDGLVRYYATVFRALRDGASNSGRML